MTTILFTFIAAFLFSLLSTPVIRNVALRWGLVDRPSARKMHHGSVPRMGGIALFLAFLFPFGLFLLVPTLPAEQVLSAPRAVGFLAGAALIFCVGLTDDIRCLSPLIKFAGQLVAALIAYHFGFQIETVSLPFSDGLALGVFSLPVTVFWFVLVINAINLVDGLDGLAAGIGLFVSLAMLFVCITNAHIIEGLAFASLAGALMGFLRYNFSPASIFMGDSGSYFLGYVLAGLSVAGSIKGQVATAMLIPVIALGIPLIDTLWAPFRRFIFGRKIFQPDRDHFHHRLVRLGYSQRSAVFLIYGFTLFLGVGAMSLVHAQDDTAALILFVLAIVAISIASYLDLYSFFTIQRMVNWARDLSDEAGISYDRRVFLQHQQKIDMAPDLDTLWKAVTEALESMEFESAEFCYFESGEGREGAEKNFKWHCDKQNPEEMADRGYFFKLELPLYCTEGEACRNFGVLFLVKEMRSELDDQYTLKRIEHLRRSMVSTLSKINRKSICVV